MNLYYLLQKSLQKQLNSEVREIVSGSAHHSKNVKSLQVLWMVQLSYLDGSIYCTVHIWRIPCVVLYWLESKMSLVALQIYIYIYWDSTGPSISYTTESLFLWRFSKSTLWKQRTVYVLLLTTSKLLHHFKSSKQWLKNNHSLFYRTFYLWREAFGATVTVLCCWYMYCIATQAPCYCQSENILYTAFT